MTRQILALQKDAYDYLISSLTSRAIKNEDIDYEKCIIDIELSDNVIMKIYDEDLILDLGARRVTLVDTDFNEIVIR